MSSIAFLILVWLTVEMFAFLWAQDKSAFELPWYTHVAGIGGFLALWQVYRKP